MAVATPLSLNNIVDEFGMGVIVGATQTFDSGSGTVTAPSNADAVRIKVWGGGGSGYSDLNTSFGGGAGAGFTLKTINVTSGSSQFTYSVGGRGEEGGSGGTSTVTSSSPSVSLTATGGGGFSVDPSAYGTGSGGDINQNGGSSAGTSGADAGGRLYGGGIGGGNIDPGAGGYGDDNGYNSGGTGRIVFEWLQKALSVYTRGDGLIANHSANANIPTSANDLRISQFSGAEKNFTATVTTDDISGTQNPPSSYATRGYKSGLYGSINRDQVGLSRNNLNTTTLLEIYTTPVFDYFFNAYFFETTAKFSGDVRTSTLGYNFFDSIAIGTSGAGLNIQFCTQSYDGVSVTTFVGVAGAYQGFGAPSTTETVTINYGGP
jgi:hypothetical protein